MLRSLCLSLEIHVLSVICTEPAVAKKSSQVVETLDAKQIDERKSSASSVSNSYNWMNLQVWKHSKTATLVEWMRLCASDLSIFLHGIRLSDVAQ